MQSNFGFPTMYNGQKTREIIFFFLFSNIDKTATIFSIEPCHRFSIIISNFTIT